MSVDCPTLGDPPDGARTMGIALPSGTVGPGIPPIPVGFEAIPCQLQKQGGDSSVYGFLIRPVQSTPATTSAPSTSAKHSQPKAILPKIAAKPPIAPYGNVEAQVEPSTSSEQQSAPSMHDDALYAQWPQQPSTSTAGTQHAYDFDNVYYTEGEVIMRHHDNGESPDHSMTAPEDFDPSTAGTSSSMRPQLDWSTSAHGARHPARYPPHAGKVVPQMAAINHGSDASATPDSGVHSINGSPQMHTPPMVSPGTQPTTAATQPLHVDTSHTTRVSFDDMPVLDAVNAKKASSSNSSSEGDRTTVIANEAMNPAALAANLVSTMAPAQLIKFQAEISKQVKKKLKTDTEPSTSSAMVDRTIESVVADAAMCSRKVESITAPAIKVEHVKAPAAKKKKMNITFEDETKRREMAEKLHLYRSRTARLINRMEMEKVGTSHIDELTALFATSAIISTIPPSKLNKAHKSPFKQSVAEPRTPLKMIPPKAKIDRYYPTMSTTPPAFAVFSKPTSTDGLRSVSACSVRPSTKKIPSYTRDMSDDDSVFQSPTTKKAKLHTSASFVPHKTYETRGLGGASSKHDMCDDLVEAMRMVDDGDMKLPYDIWFELRGAKAIDPSQQYRKIRNNVIIDAPPSTSTAVPCECSTSCDETCLNRSLLIECTAACCSLADGRQCSNRRMQTRGTPRSVQLFDTHSPRGMGVRAVERIGAGAFLGEYVGEVVTTERLHERQRTFYKTYFHHYAVAISARHSIDAYLCGNLMRYINHSCRPNAVMQKWVVNGVPRCGIYALHDLDTGEEITYDYQFASHNKSQTCLCGSEQCRRTIAPPNVAVAETSFTTVTTTAEKLVAQKRRLLLWRCRRRKLSDAVNYAFMSRPRVADVQSRSTSRASIQSPTPSTSSASTAKLAAGDVLLSSTVDLDYVGTSVRVDDDEEQVSDGQLPSTASGDDQVRCVCGCVDEDGQMVMCEKCGYWLHSDCTRASIDVDPFECLFCTDSLRTPPRRDMSIAEVPQISLPNCTYFRTFDGRCTVRINEFVYVKRVINDRHKQRLTAFHQLVTKGGQTSRLPADIEESDDELDEAMLKRCNLRVFRVHRLLKGPDNSRYVFGNYYARPHETFCEPTRRFVRQELLQTPLYDTLPLSAVVARCVVLDPLAYCKGRPIYPRYPDEDDVYMCEFRVDKAQRVFERIKDKTRLELTTADLKDYIFESFADKRTIRRNFTPFVLSSEQSTSSTSPTSGRHSRPLAFRQQRVDRLGKVVKRLRLNQ